MTQTPLPSWVFPTPTWKNLPDRSTTWRAADGNYWQAALETLRAFANTTAGRVDSISGSLGVFGEVKPKGTVYASDGTTPVAVPTGTGLQVLTAGQATASGVAWVNLHPGPWTAPSFPTAWNTSTLKYRVAGDRIEWRGDLIRASASAPTGTETMCTLPPEARPPATVNLKWAGAIGATTGIFDVTITAAGVVSVNTASSNGNSLPAYATFCPTGLTYSTTA